MAVTRPPRPETDSDLALRELAEFRYQLRRFLRFSERAARQHGMTPLQHQLLLGLAGFARNGSATISEMAEFLQERHNAVVALIQRAERAGLVKKSRGHDDRREVRVSITRRGAQMLRKLSELHLRELAGLKRRVPRGIPGNSWAAAEENSKPVQKSNAGNHRSKPAA